MLPIREIFASIQGEGSFMGMPVVFVRINGCNLRCSFCDTRSSWDSSMEEFEDFRMLTVEEVLAEVKRVSKGEIHTVVLTGGEPCIHPETDKLVDQLQFDYTVCIETNGTQETPNMAHWVTCSPKPDADYIINSFCKANELKYVVTVDFDPSVITEHIRDKYAGKIWLQPDGTTPITMSAAWQDCYKLAMADPRLRVGVQLHKLMEVQ